MTISIERVWNDYRRELHKFIGGKSRNAADADDILQNVFLKVCTHLENIREPEKIRGWLYRIAANAVVDYYRVKKIEVGLPKDFEKIEIPEMPEAAVSDGCFQQMQACLIRMIDRLPTKYQTTVKLSELEEWTNKQIAALQNISLSGVKSRVQRGRRMIRKMLEDCCRFEVDGRGHPIGCEPKSTRKICC